MLKKKETPEDRVPTPLTLTLPARVVRDLKQMEKHTKFPVDELATKALQMFIATHNDYLGKRS